MRRCQCWPTVLGDEGVVRGVEGQEPVPVWVEPEQHGRGAKRAGEPGGAHGCPGSRVADDRDVLERSHRGSGGDDPGS